MRAVVLGASALVLCLGGTLGVLHAADPPLVTVAVLRGDGIIIPIATRSGKKWSHTWPVPDKAADVPLDAADLPKRWWGKAGPTTTWRSWQIDGSTADAVVERPTWYLAHCQQGIGLKTALTAQPPLPPPTTQPYPKLGLAFTAPITVRRVEPVDQSDPVWMRVADKVDAAMKAAEATMNGMPVMTVDGPRPVHPIAPAERAKVAARVETLYRLGIGGDRVLYYVEATKRYGMPSMPAERAATVPSPKGGCSVMTFGNGFFVVGADGVVPDPTLRVSLTSCGYDDVSLMLPLGAIGDGNPVWIGQVTGWDYESYVGFQWDGERGEIAELFATRGGWCAGAE